MTRRSLLLALVLILGTVTAQSQITVRVWDNGSSKDDRARVYVDGVQLTGATETAGDGTGYTRASNEGTTWDLGVLSPGTHTLTVEHAMDIDAPILAPCAEVVGTYGIEFGGGGLSALPDFDQVDRGSTVTIDVLANDVLIEAASSATDTIPCPSELPAPGTECGCSTRHTFETTFDILNGSGTLEVDSIVTPPLWGTAEISFDRSSIVYTPGAEACGSDAFEYSVSAPGAGTAYASVAVTVFNALPIAANDAYDATEDEAFLLFGPGVLENDFDGNGDALAALLIQGVSHGTLVLAEDGGLTYEPFADYSGVDAFTYRADDGCATSASATVTLTVAAVNDAPIGAEDAYTLAGPGQLAVPAPGVLANDTDAEGDRLQAVLAQGPQGGVLQLNADGSFTYRSQAGFSGIDSFLYRATDEIDASASIRVEIEVLYVNTPPVADAGSFYEGDVGEAVALDASLSFDRDVLDRLQFRWDFDYDWVYDTDWLDSSFATHTWDLPYEGFVGLQVRDLYQSVPTGDTAEATTYVSIHSVQSIRVVAFEDADGDGKPSSDEPRLSGLAVSVGGESLVTGSDGTVATRLSPGSWTVALAPSAIETLAGQGYEVLETEATVEIAPGEERIVTFAALRTTTKLKGVVYVDANGDGVYGEVDSPVAGLRVTLDGNPATRTLTNAQGRFFFLRVRFGEHRLVVAETPAQGESESDAIKTEVPILLSRGGPSEIYVTWLATIGPAEGFLDVKVKMGGGG